MGARHWERRRRGGNRSLLVSGGLVLLLGALGLLAGHRAQAQAVAVHREDRLELQEMLGNLVGQYASVVASDVDAHGGLTATADEPWSTRAGDPVTTERLQRLLRAARSLDAGVVLLDAAGRPLGAATRTGVRLPAQDDPGWGALRAAVAARVLPVSDLLDAEGSAQLAFGVPTTLAGDGAPGLLLGLVHARTAGLQAYVADLTQEAARTGWVVDGAGLVIAGPDTGRIGRPLPLREAGAAARAGRRGLLDVEHAGTPWVVSAASGGSTTWTALTSEQRESFQGDLERSGWAVMGLLAALLLIAGSGLVVLSRKREAALARIALYDDLTGVHNRRGWFELAESELRRAERAGQQRVLLFVDLDGLKQVNDVLGHREGDRAIADVARVLCAASRRSDLVGRLGGDEFVLLLADGADLEAARRRVLDALVAHNAASRSPYELRLSLGAEVWFPDADCSLDELVRRADAQMYAHKRSRPSRGQGVLRPSATLPAPAG